MTISMALYRSLIHLLLLATLLEQILWRGESARLFPYALLFTSLELMLIFWNSKKSLLILVVVLLGGLCVFHLTPRPILQKYEHFFIVFATIILLITFFQNMEKKSFRPQISVLQVMSIVSIAMFSLLANLGQREYFIMAGEPIGLLVYSDLWCLALLLTILLLSFFSKSLLSTLSTLTALSYVLYLFLGGTDFTTSGTELISTEADPQYRVASCALLILLLSLIYSFKTPRNSPQSKILRRIDPGFAVAGLLLLSFLGMAMWQRIKREPCVTHTNGYKISQEMALHLFVAEDPLYYFHHGIEFHGIRMAFARYLETGSKRFGGSTISMQLAKVCYLSFEKTFSRKIRQAILGALLELSYSKEDILSSYLEHISFSPDAVGLSRAAEKFYNKTPSQLSASESMMLTLSIQDPYNFNPESKSIPKVIRGRRAVTAARVRTFRAKLLPRLRALDTVM